MSIFNISAWQSQGNISNLEICRLCPATLSLEQHKRFHSPIFHLHLSISKKFNKYHPFLLKPNTLNYKYKTKEMILLHQLGFCTTQLDFDKNYSEIIALTKEIQGLMKKTRPRKPLRI
jgi:hypothetical protein